MHILTAALSAAVLVLPATPVLAHDGALHAGLLAGLAHPLGGLDHLLATFGVGLVAGAAADPARRGAGAGGWRSGFAGRAALAAAAGLAAGAMAATVLGLAGLAGAAVEQAAALGLLAVALALVLARRIGPLGSAALALAVLLPHGMLHASEGGGAAFFAGLAVASAGLFALGHLAGRAIRPAMLPSTRVNTVRWAVSAGYAGVFVLLLAG